MHVHKVTDTQTQIFLLQINSSENRKWLSMHDQNQMLYCDTELEEATCQIMLIIYHTIASLK